MQESIVETLKNMKSEQNLTLQQISSASGVPLSTVNRILSGQTENPSFRDVAAIVAAMDGSLDAITGLQKLESENSQLLDSNVMQLLLSMQETINAEAVIDLTEGTIMGGSLRTKTSSTGISLPIKTAGCAACFSA